MADLEKVLRGLECCTHMGRELHRGGCSRCPYEKDKPDCRAQRDRDTLEILREQELVEPGKVQMGNRTDWYCRNCTTIVGRQFSEEDAWRFHHNFCPYCGKKVKWK